MKRVFILSLLLALSLLFTPARGQEAAGGPTWELSGLSLRPEGLYRGESPAEASSPDGWSSGARASISPALGPLAPVTALYAAAPAADRKFYVQLRSGPLFFIDDFSHHNPGVDTEVAFGVYPIKVLAFEVFSGFMWGEDTGGSMDSRVWAVPIVGNAKVVIPVLDSLEAYAGAGIGAYWLRAEVENRSIEDCDCDWVFGGNVFVGVDFDLGPVFVSLEGKYILTDSIGTGNGSANLQGIAILAGVGVRF